MLHAWSEILLETLKITQMVSKYLHYFQKIKVHYHIHKPLQLGEAVLHPYALLVLC
jgi:hypothetical protein